MKKVQFLKKLYLSVINNRQSRPAQILLPDCVSCLNLDHAIQGKFLNGAAGLEFNAKIIGGLSFRAEAIATRIHPNISNYEGYYYPSTKPTDTRFFQTGLSYVNKWMNVVSQIIYISQSNYNTSENFQHKLQKPVGELPP